VDRMRAIRSCSVNCQLFIAHLLWPRRGLGLFTGDKSSTQLDSV
jgi:hypothetical protein